MSAYALVYDKLLYLDRLKSAGVSEEIARADADGLDQALRESVATKSDVEAVKADLQAVKAELETKLDAKIDTSVARLETKIAEAHVATTRWMIGSFLATTGLFWALVKYAH
jgi:predicted RNA-binding protein associated with RNAse of E/G family